MAAQQQLFATTSPLPGGLVYHPDFLSADEERALLETIERLPLAEARYKSFTAKRRILTFGGSYDFDAGELGPAPPIPDVLLPLREKVATWSGIPASDLTHGLVA